MNVHGYTTLMSPEAIRLPYLETLLSWSRLCKTITICYSTFPQLDIEVEKGAVAPWEDDGSRKILEQFDKEVLGGKLRWVEHEWDIKEPQEDGVTKQLAREGALEQCHDDPDGWVVQFDADEILRDDDDLNLIQAIDEDNKNETHKRHPFILTGILELFGGTDTVRFDNGNWVKIRATRNINELRHGLPLRFGPIPVRGRNPRTGKIIALENRDDCAGFISELTWNRPDYNMGIFQLNPQVIQMIRQVGQVAPEQRANYWHQCAQALGQDLMAGSVWLYHTGWVDIARKWSMGWWFDNFISVMAGRQDTYEAKTGLRGNYFRLRAPEGGLLEEELEKEMSNPSIRKLTVPLDQPSVFQTVKEWREQPED